MENTNQVLTVVTLAKIEGRLLSIDAGVTTKAVRYGTSDNLYSVYLSDSSNWSIVADKSFIKVVS